MHFHGTSAGRPHEHYEEQYSGQVSIEEIDHGDLEAPDWNAWMDYRRSPEGQWATPERARQMMQDEGLFNA